MGSCCCAEKEHAPVLVHQMNIPHRHFPTTFPRCTKFHIMHMQNQTPLYPVYGGFQINVKQEDDKINVSTACDDILSCFSKT